LPDRHLRGRLAVADRVAGAASRAGGDWGRRGVWGGIISGVEFTRPGARGRPGRMGSRHGGAGSAGGA
jgi:hypothetical protein